MYGQVWNAHSVKYFISFLHWSASHLHIAPFDNKNYFVTLHVKRFRYNHASDDIQW